MKFRLGRPARMFAALMMPLATLGFGPPTSAILAHADEGEGGGGCQLASAGGNIQHVIYVQFDNTHFTRDNPNVPSDLSKCRIC